MARRESPSVEIDQRHIAFVLTSGRQTIGIASIAWMVVQMAVGGGSVWFGGRLFGGPKAKLLWKYHR